ncbi:MAG: hypothetical protein SGI77_16930 [Pirellulaceae bacterium]|nr:hypothetical protein [Pirellulaceae bacterium]
MAKARKAKVFLTDRAIADQVVVQKDTYHANRRVAHPAGSVGVIVRSPIDRSHAYLEISIE